MNYRQELHHLSIALAVVPIQMHKGQAVRPYPPDPESYALRLVLIFFGQAVIQHFVNGIVRDM